MNKENIEGGENVEDVCFRKVRKRRQKALVQEMLHDYATNTTLHGLPYITRKGFTVVEKIFWIATFISSICFCSYFINNSFLKLMTSPFMVSISETLVPVGDVPFPSVTICPQLKIKKSVFDYATEDLTQEHLNNELYESYFIKRNFSDIKKLDDLSLVCNDKRMYNQLTPYSRIQQIMPMIKRHLKENETSTTENIKNVAPKKEDIFVTCYWRGLIDKNCKRTVSEIITSEGLCYNINSLAASDIFRQDNSTLHFNAANKAIKWSMDEGYETVDPDVYPAVGKAFDSTPDLEIIFQDNLEDHGEGCNSVNHGFFKVYIQHPADLPQSSLYYYVVQNGEVSSMALSFNKINTAAAVGAYDPQIRQCYFPEEFYLSFFKIYTENNCILECLSNVTYKSCGCVGFYMPRHSDTKICTFVENRCMRIARDYFVHTEAHTNKKKCMCLPLCSAIDYHAEIHKTSFDYQSFLRHHDLPSNKNVSYSKLEMFYKAPRFLSMYRSELFSRTDFFANIGGLLGLFLGFSFLSLIELFYYLTMRLYCIIKKDLKQEKLQRSNAITNRQRRF